MTGWSDADVQDAGRDALAIMRAVSAAQGEWSPDAQAVYALADQQALMQLFAAAYDELAVRYARAIGVPGDDDEVRAFVAAQLAAQQAQLLGDPGLLTRPEI